MRVSGTYLPPKRPNLPKGSGLWKWRREEGAGGEGERVQETGRRGEEQGGDAQGCAQEEEERDREVATIAIARNHSSSSSS